MDINVINGGFDTVYQCLPEEMDQSAAVINLLQLLTVCCINICTRADKLEISEPHRAWSDISTMVCLGCGKRRQSTIFHMQIMKAVYDCCLPKDILRLKDMLNTMSTSCSCTDIFYSASKSR